MEQIIVRSYQGKGDSYMSINELLSDGWVVVRSTVILPSGYLSGYIEYVLERQSIPRGVEND
jgi:hypothetical protein